MPDDASYVIQTGVGAHDRLEMLARLFRPTTETFLAGVGAFDVDRFLDVGCGIGDVACRVATHGGQALGVDANADVVELARSRAASTGATASFRVGSLTALGTEDDLRDHDAVYARCVLTHQSDPRAGLAAMLRAARPGGLVLVEDVEVAAVWSSPPDAALRRHLELYVAAAHGLGARPEFAAEVAPTLRDLGATDVHVDVVQPLLRTPEDILAHACTMEAIADPVIAQGLATAEEVATLVTDLDEFATTPGAVATLPRLAQVSARAPTR